MTKTYDDRIGLRQLLYICKAEKTPLNDKLVIGGLCVWWTVADKLQTTGASKLFCLKDIWMY